MKSSYEQVNDDQKQLNGEIHALTIKIESKVHDISKELEQGGRTTTTSRALECFHDGSEIASPPKVGLGRMPVRASAGKTQTEDGSILNESIIFPEDEEGDRHPAASPISSIPNIDEVGSEAAWRATVLLVLSTSSGMWVWELSERYTAWLSVCHIKLGVAGTGSHAFSSY